MTSTQKCHAVDDFFTVAPDSADVSFMEDKPPQNRPLALFRQSALEKCLNSGTKPDKVR